MSSNAGGKNNRNSEDEFKTRKERETMQNTERIQKLYCNNTNRMHRGDAQQMDKDTEGIQ